MRTLNLVPLLVRLKVFDPDGTLSLSNVTMMVLVGKLATSQALDWSTMTAFFLALLNHNAKKHWARSKVAKEVGDADKLKALEAEVKSLSSAFNFKNLGR